MYIFVPSVSMILAPDSPSLPAGVQPDPVAKGDVSVHDSIRPRHCDDWTPPGDVLQRQQGTRETQAWIQKKTASIAIHHSSSINQNHQENPTSKGYSSESWSETAAPHLLSG